MRSSGKVVESAGYHEDERPPVIAIPAHRLPPGRVNRWWDGAFAVQSACVDLLSCTEAAVIILTAPDPRPPERILESVDGLLLVGGADVDPIRYGAQPHPHVYGIDPHRDELEIGLVRAADHMKVPTVAICRGAHIVNVAFGGDLIQHLPEVEGPLVNHGQPNGGEPAVHDVKVAYPSRLAACCNQDTLKKCSSHHHQAIGRVGEGLVAVGWTEDGLVEALEREEGWMLAVCWHPEETASQDSAQQSLLNSLVDKARERVRAGLAS
jgi:putative glutamine amidotransferase